MARRAFDRFMLDLEIGRNLKLSRLNDSEFRCFVAGVLPIAAKAPVRGCLLVGTRPADVQDIALQAGVARTAAARSALVKLRDVGILYHDGDLDCERVHDWDDWQVEPRSDKTAARRQALHRDTKLRDEIRTRDQDRCRYCGVDVRWQDRRGPHGGTYDHVDPDGPNAAWNLVVACRGCNSSKRNRTPAEAGLNLLPEPDPTYSRSKSDLALSTPEVEGEGEGEVLYPFSHYGSGRAPEAENSDFRDSPSERGVA